MPNPPTGAEIGEKLAAMGMDLSQAAMGTSDLQLDMEGFASEHPMFDWALEQAQPNLVIEVGTWKGASLANMHKISRQLGLDTYFISIDTWLGSNAPYWERDKHRPSLQITAGYPTMFRQFAFNMTTLGLEQSVTAMPMTASCAFDILADIGAVADLIYIDAGHHFYEAHTDISLFYDLLRPGGIMLGDDYIETFPGVVQAVNRFAADKNLILKCDTGKWAFCKKELPYKSL